MSVKFRGYGILSLTLVLGVAAGWYAMHDMEQAHAANTPAPQSPQPGVPVATAKAQVHDVPVFLSGLGTVQALNTVEVKAQVNGYLISLPVKEGQEVEQGDIVAQIDPRPYKAALDQATAQRD